MGKKLIFITSRLLWPIDNGRKTSLNYYCKGLHEVYGYDIYLYSFKDHDRVEQIQLPSYVKELRTASDIKISQKAKNVIFRSLGKDKWPLQCSLYFSEENAKQIVQYCEDVQPDVVITEMIRTATYYEYFKSHTNKTIANIDDLLSKRYRRQAESKYTGANVMGGYAQRLSADLNRFLNLKAIKKKVLRFEADCCERWEGQFYQLYDHLLFTSPLEAEEMNRRYGGNKASALSVGVDMEALVNDKFDVCKERNSLSFVGNFSFAPNVDTLKMMCDEILPHVKHKYKLYLIGKCPKDVMAEYSDNPNLEFVGRVDDLAEYVHRTSVFFSPIAYGTGIKTKIIEAMAMGMPVITNDVGAEGIAAVNGEHMIIENDPIKIAEAIDLLLDDQTLCAHLGRKAQEFAYERFRWPVVYKVFEEIGL